MLRLGKIKADFLFLSLYESIYPMNANLLIHLLLLLLRRLRAVGSRPL